jgi:molybdopterin-containing oxidoreductase family iron-sulfur binding subunit
MSNHDQCHSTQGHATAAGALPGAGSKAIKAGKAELASVARPLPRVNGVAMWRSLEEVLDTPAFREHLEREFPAGASELSRVEGSAEGVSGGRYATGETRREFLKYMGASMALAGVATIPGCRRPDHKIMPYSREVPEEVIPGKPLYYATSMARLGGGAEGLLVETHEGRPTKIEGNPLHPHNQGKCSIWALSSILSLYDPDRLMYPWYTNPARGRLEASWDEFRTWGKEHFAALSGDSGEHLAILANKVSSPSRDAAREAILKKYPKATWVSYDPSEATAPVEGARVAFGRAVRESYNFSRDTRVVLSIDRDFVSQCSDDLPNARGFAATRRVTKTSDAMSRLYVVEPGMSLTGGQADHRLRLRPGLLSTFVVELAKFILPKLGSEMVGPIAGAIGAVPVGKLDGEAVRFVEECGKDLLDAANRGKSIVMGGPTLPAEAHALVHAMNAALGNVGKGVSYLPMTDDEASASVPALAAMVERIHSGAITTLVCLETNPAYDAPGDLKFLDAVKKLKALITLSTQPSETSALATWALNGAHYLESWGDTRSHDGTVAPVQPMIAPLYEPAMSDLEFLALLAGGDFMAKVDGYEIVRASLKKSISGDFEKGWRRALHDGVVAGTGKKGEPVAIDAGRIAKAIAGMKPAGSGTLDVVFQIGRVGDGRYANNAWLQELPQVGTMVVWDNPILLSPKTAAALKVSPEGYSDHDPSNIYNEGRFPHARLVELTVGGVKEVFAAWILPGMADDTAIVTFGYGREKTGKVCDGVGFNAFAMRSSAIAATGMHAAFGASAGASPGTRLIASTQNHWSMEGRTAIVRAVDLPAWQRHGDSLADGGSTFYRENAKLNFAEQLGDLLHAPPNESIYENPYNKSKEGAAPGSKYSEGQQWGMTIDLSACTGCGACTIACQSENNIPVVGKRETAKGRELAWMRVDRYFTGDDVNNPQNMLVQPVACVHCENAPCETVCPVNATIHGPEGINYMTYNRCIGTRYCANNCPYKVRRFNYFEYGKLAFNGDYIGKDILNDLAPERGGVNGSDRHNKFNINLIPPRLREKLSEIERMGKNPNVSVRMRGVMEKCSYCIQRINAARIECKLHDLKDPKSGKPFIPDGFFQSACQQACPSEAIVFGDTLDPASKVSQTRAHARSYALLGYLNTRPRTSHMVRVMNPNPALRAPVTDPIHHGTDPGAGHGGGHATVPTHEPAGVELVRRRRGVLSLLVLNNGAHA